MSRLLIVIISYVTEAVFKWTPYNTNQVRLGFSASDGRGFSVVEVDVLVCDCKNEGVCDYSSFVENSNLVEDKFAVSSRADAVIITVI